MNSNEPKGFSLSEGAVIAAAPFLAYLFAFVFESGFANIFKIPLQFITVGLTSVFIAGGSLLLIGIFLFILSDLILMLLPDHKGPIIRSLASFFPMFLTTIAILIYLIGTRLQSSLIGIGVIWLITFFFEFVFPLLTQRGKGTYREKLEAQGELEEFRIRKGLRGALTRRTGRFYHIVYFLSLALWVTYSAGQSTALRQREFLVTNTSPELVVLRKYGETFISVTLDRDKHLIEPEFALIKINDDGYPSLRLEIIGPLSLSDESTIDQSSTITPCQEDNEEGTPLDSTEEMKP